MNKVHFEQYLNIPQHQGYLSCAVLGLFFWSLFVFANSWCPCWLQSIEARAFFNRSGSPIDFYPDTVSAHPGETVKPWTSSLKIGHITQEKIGYLKGSYTFIYTIYTNLWELLHVITMVILSPSRTFDLR